MSGTKEEYARRIDRRENKFKKRNAVVALALKYKSLNPPWNPHPVADDDPGPGMKLPERIIADVYRINATSDEEKIMLGVAAILFPRTGCTWKDFYEGRTVPARCLRQAMWTMMARKGLTITAIARLSRRFFSSVSYVLNNSTETQISERLGISVWRARLLLEDDDSTETGLQPAEIGVISARKEPDHV